MADFNYSMKFDVFGASNVEKIIAAFAKAGVELEHVDKEVRQFGESLEQIGKFSFANKPVSEINKIVQALEKLQRAKKLSKLGVNEIHDSMGVSTTAGKVLEGFERRKAYRRAIEKLHRNKVLNPANAIFDKLDHHDVDVSARPISDFKAEGKDWEDRLKLRAQYVKERVAAQRELNKALGQENTIMAAGNAGQRTIRLKHHNRSLEYAALSTKMSNSDEERARKASFDDFDRRLKSNDATRKRVSENTKKAHESERKEASHSYNAEIIAIQSRLNSASAATSQITNQYKRISQASAASAKASAAHWNKAAHAMQHGMTHAADHISSTLRHIAAGAAAIFVGHSLVAGIRGAGEEIFEIGKKLLEFNDELLKSKQLIVGLGISSTGKTQYSIRNGLKNDGTPENAATATKQKQMLDFSEKVGERFSTFLRGESSLTGQSFEEVFKAAKNVVFESQARYGRNHPGHNELLEQPDVMMQSVSSAVRLATLFKNIGGRGDLAWNEFAIRKALEGTLDKKAPKPDKHGHVRTQEDPSGRANFRSFLMRNQINFSEKDMTAITKAANKSLEDGMKVLTEKLKQYGYSESKLLDMIANSLKINVEGVKNSLMYLGSVFSGPVFEKMQYFFKWMNAYLVSVTRYQPFLDFIKNLGQRFADIIGINFNKIITFITFLESPKGGDWIAVQVEKFIGMVKILNEVGQLGVSFLIGFFGMKKNEGVEKTRNSVEEICKNLRNSQPVVQELGRVMAEIATSAMKASVAILKIMDKLPLFNAKEGEDGFVTINGKKVPVDNWDGSDGSKNKPNLRWPRADFGTSNGSGGGSPVGFSDWLHSFNFQKPTQPTPIAPTPAQPALPQTITQKIDYGQLNRPNQITIESVILQGVSSPMDLANRLNSLAQSKLGFQEINAALPRN